MFTGLGIRWRVLAVLALPVVMIALASGAVSLAALSDVRDAQRVGELAAAGDQLSQVIAAVQAERQISVAAASGDARARSALSTARTATDRQVSALDSALDASQVAALSPRAGSAVDALLSAQNRLRGVRRDVDTGGKDAGTVLSAYSQIIAVDVDLPGAIADTLTDRDQASGLEASTLLGRAAEGAAREQLIGAQLLRSQRASLSWLAALSVAIDEQDGAVNQFHTQASAGQWAALGHALTSSRATADLTGQRDRLKAGKSVSAGTWQAATAYRVNVLRALGHTVTGAAAEAATRIVDAKRQRVAFAGGAAVALVGLCVLFALVQSRRISAPLRLLTEATAEMRDQLPALVAKAQTAAAQVEDLAQADIETTRFRGREVSRLADAFRDVQVTTLQIAREQAELRSGVAEMFVNVARRNQVLLSRLLAFIDQLERSEEDPDVLDDLFRIDHLATRMRRNAESLLVLAGVDSGRRLRGPMPLSDVVRTATSEIEHFDRVAMVLPVDPPVVAHLALPAAHLVAELLENATTFSDPGLPVTVEVLKVRTGITLRVSDSGLGMRPEEIAEANARLADASSPEVVGSARLGLFVVGRLAARLDARVRLESGEVAGTVAIVEFPPSLFASGAVLELPAEQAPQFADGAQRLTVEPEVFEPEPLTAPDPEPVELPPGSDGEPAPSLVVPVSPPAPLPSRREVRAAEAAESGGGFLPSTMDVLPRRSARGGLRIGRRERAGSPGAGAGAGAVALSRPRAGNGDGADEPFRAPPSGARWVGEQRQALDDVDDERLRSAIASEALHELSRLSSYRPDTVSSAPSSLARRAPAATSAPAPSEPAVTTDEPVVARERTPSDVRAMFSGFHSGVRRAREAPASQASSSPPGEREGRNE